MKKTMKKWTSFLVAMALVLAMLTTAMAETIYITDGFTLSAGLIGGYRPTPTPTEEPVIGEDADPTPKNAETPEETPQPGEESKDEALDEQNVEGLVVVDGEEKTEDKNITEQTEVQTKDADGEAMIENPDNEVENNNDEDKKSEEDKDESISQDSVNEPDNETLETEQKMIDVRERADGLSDIILQIPADSNVEILGVEGKWYKVNVEGTVGYIFGGDYTGNSEYEIDFSDVTITAFSSRKPNMVPGETVTMTCQVLGYTLEYPLQYQWTVDRHDGTGWQEVANGASPTYEFAASQETLAYDWQILVYIEIPD